MEYISLTLWEKLSIVIGTEEQVYIRRRAFDLIEIIGTKTYGYKTIMGGSRAEGLSLPDSDFDRMGVIRDASVSDNPADSHNDIFMDTNNIKPGFVRLRILNRLMNYGNFFCSMTQTCEGTFLSSLLFRDQLVESFKKKYPSAYAHGPCATTETQFKEEIDHLRCFSCKTWPRIASEWLDRIRNNNWPSAELITNISSDGCLLVPIGNPNSQEGHMQWRISFSLAEKKLVHSFNHTQLLCYALLKLYLKHAINSNAEVKGLLCSYFLKTSLFFCIEDQNIVWSKENFIDCFWTCLRRLMAWVRDEYCPNYFIKDNNMFEGKVSGRKARLLFDHLFKLYNDGLDSLRFIPCLSKLQIFVNTNRAIQPRFGTEVSLSNEEKECLCDIEILHQSTGFFKMENSTKINVVIGEIMQQASNPIDKGILSMMVYSTFSKTVPSMYKDIQTTTSHKIRYKQINGIKRFIIQNCLVTDVCSGMLMLATLCYLDGEYQEVVTVVQKVLQKFKPYTVYVGSGQTKCAHQAYINKMCGKGFTINQKLARKALAIPFVCDINNKFHAQEIEPELVQHSTERRTFIPPKVYSYVLLFLSYYHMGRRENMSYTLTELYTATHDERFVTEFEKPLANALLMKCLQMLETY